MQRSLIYSLFMMLVFPILLTAQTITGKLVDQTGLGLSELQLQLYINPKVYNTTSGADGAFTFNNITGIKNSELPIDYEVSNNYPNPFNPKTRIDISLPNSGIIKVEVYNLLGQRVCDVIERYYNSGISHIDLELNGLPNGFYIARITINKKNIVSKKLMLMYGTQHLSSSVGSSIPQLKNVVLDGKSIIETKIDSLVITGISIVKKVFTNLPDMTGSSLNLGNLIIGLPPQAPILSSPTDSSTGLSVTPILTWKPSLTATSYTLQVSTDSSFSNLVYNQNGLTSTSKLVIGLSTLTQYFWRVSATNSYGTSVNSFFWSFTTSTVPVTSVKLNKSNTTKYIGDVEQLNANINPANATNKNITWTTSNASVAEVSSSGLITAVAVGISTITVTTADGNKTDSCIVTVSNYYKDTGIAYNAPDGLTVTMDSIKVIEKTGSYQYQIFYTLKNNTPDRAIDEGTFALFKRGTTNHLPQYGFFDKLYPSDSITRSYTFEEVKTITFNVVEYGAEFFASEPSAANLKWAITYDTSSLPAPSNLQIASMTTSQVSLSWTDNSNYETSFEVEQSNDGVNFYVVKTVGSNVDSTTVSGTFDSTTTYYFRVQAKTVINKSGYSNVASREIYSLVFVQGGTFQMGSTFDPFEQPVHLVTVASFSIEKYEITYENWMDVRNWGLINGYIDLAVGQNGSNHIGTNNPVGAVNWYDVVKWCNARSEKEGLTPVYYTSDTLSTVYRTGELNLTADAVQWTANGYRLPTEAEWEFAARGGTISQGYTYSGSDSLNYVAWNSSNSGGATHTVGTKSANELGIFDMTGNIVEWCWDRYGSYSSNAQIDPKGPTSGGGRIIRGGSFSDPSNDCRVSFRNGNSMDWPSYNYGFRCVKN